jgi:hypothetical protein
MPFGKDFNDTYELGIKAACVDCGAYCERVDEQIFHGSILQRIYNQIAKADIVVADMTGRNPNVFYEVGYAHALGKRVILLTRAAEDIPFDLKDYSHIVYEGSIIALRRELERRLVWLIAHPGDDLQRVDPLILFFLNGKALEPDSLHEMELDDTLDTYSFVTLHFSIYNSGDHIVDVSRFEFGVVLPAALRYSLGGHVVTLPNNQCIYLFNDLGRILPHGWKPLPLVLDTSSDNRNTSAYDELKALDSKLIPCRFDFFGELATRSVEFRLRIFSAKQLALSSHDLEDAKIQADKAVRAKPSTAYDISCAFALKGWKNEALRLLAMAISQSPYAKYRARSDPDFQHLREDPEFVSLTSDLHAPDDPSDDNPAMREAAPTQDLPEGV